MLTYTKDKNKEEILLDNNNEQVMMEWEKPYMEACIDFLQPKGNVLEIGFGMGYSATAIQKYNPKSYTIIECDPIVIKKCKEWAKDYDNVIIIESKWQDVIETLGTYDSIFFDPTETSNLSTAAYKIAHFNWHFIFIELCIQYLMKLGSRLSVFLPTYLNYKYKKFISDQLFISHYNKIIKVPISDQCKYKRPTEELMVPIIEKIQ